MSTFFCTGCCACKPTECECSSIQYETARKKYQDLRDQKESRTCTIICDNKDLAYSSDDYDMCKSKDNKNDYSLYNKCSNENFDPCFQECEKKHNTSICRHDASDPCTSTDDQSVCTKRTGPRSKKSAHCRQIKSSYPSDKSSCKSRKKVTGSSPLKVSVATCSTKGSRSSSNTKICNEKRNIPNSKNPSLSTKCSMPEATCTDGNANRFDIKLPECLENLPEYLEKLLTPKRTCPKAPEKTLSEPKECIQRKSTECMTVPVGEVKSVTICLDKPWTDRPKSQSCSTKFSGDRQSPLKPSLSKQKCSKSLTSESDMLTCQYENEHAAVCPNQRYGELHTCACTKTSSEKMQNSISERQPCIHDISEEICEHFKQPEIENKSCSVQISNHNFAEKPAPCPCHSKACSTGSLEKKEVQKPTVCEAETTTSYMGNMYDYLEKETQNLCNNIKRDLGKH